jgi:Flp pilus assembly protein TadG
VSPLLDRRAGPDRGTVALELVIVIPALVALFLLISAFGVVIHARGIVDGAARDAARAGSIERNTGAANAAAQRAARDTLRLNQVTCAGTSVNPSGSLVPGGDYRVTVSCSVSLSSLGLRGLPGQVRLESTESSFVDCFRGVDTGAPFNPRCDG